MDYSMGYDDEPYCLWLRIKFYIFLKMGGSLWKYTIFHEDHWKKCYGISFTNNRDFVKRTKYDMADMDDDLEVEIKKKI